MKLHLFLFICALLPSATAIAQVEMTSDNVFPADTEFPELHRSSNELFNDPAGLSKLDDGRLFEDVGFERYAKRNYAIGDSGSLSIEVVLLRDFRAAYSLLTLLRNSSIQAGPPGVVFTMASDGIRFAKRKEWVRIQASGVQEDLIKRIAFSISNRLGQGGHSLPSLVSHLPKLGFDPSSLRYFPGMKSFETYSRKTGGALFKLNTDMEIVQARYSLENHTGDLSLLSFPTTQAAEECFEELTISKSVEKNDSTMYARRVGPLIALLEGSLDPSSADRILSTIKHSYSISWLKDNKPAVVWGIPTSILRTVVKSFFFVGLLCVVSVIAGAGLAFFRFFLRRRASNNILDRQSEITHLRLR
jgi:hypothetical protein